MDSPARSWSPQNCAGTVALLGMVLLGARWPAAAYAQERTVIADVTGGYAAITDEPIGFLAIGGGVRRHLSARVSVGPEFILMFRGGSCSAAGRAERTTCADAADRAAVLGANLAYDLLAPTARNGSVALYALAGVAALWQRRGAGDHRTWSSEFAMNVGGGVRVRLTRRLSMGGEYRFGSALRHRLTGSFGVHW